MGQQRGRLMLSAGRVHRARRATLATIPSHPLLDVTRYEPAAAQISWRCGREKSHPIGDAPFVADGRHRGYGDPVQLVSAPVDTTRRRSTRVIVLLRLAVAGSARSARRRV